MRPDLSKPTSFINLESENRHPFIIEQPHDKTNNVVVHPAKTHSDQPGHPPSVIRVLAVRLKGSVVPKLSSCGQQRL